MNREAVIGQLEEMRKNSLVADLAFHAWRKPGKDMVPFWKAALERNPVSLEGCAQLSPQQAYTVLAGFTDESIYHDDRIAMPDEVWNFRMGDGFEKSVVMANLLKHCFPDGEGALEKKGSLVRIIHNSGIYSYQTNKNIPDMSFEF